MKPKSVQLLTKMDGFGEIVFRKTPSESINLHQCIQSPIKLNFAKIFLKKIKNFLNKTIPLTPTKKTILIAEDEEFNFLYLKTILSSHNFHLLRAHNGKEAVEICDSNAKIDLILMDIKMPIMNGFEATTIIHKLMPDLPIIAQTAYSTANDKKKAFSCGCSDFLSKPFTQEDLIEKIEAHIN